MSADVGRWWPKPFDVYHLAVLAYIFFQVPDYIATCEKWKSSKALIQRLQAPMGNALASDRVFQSVINDVIDSFLRSCAGNIGSIVALDSVSKFPLVESIKRFTANEKRIFNVFRVPTSRVPDALYNNFQ